MGSPHTKGSNRSLTDGRFPSLARRSSFSHLESARAVWRTDGVRPSSWASRTSLMRSLSELLKASSRHAASSGSMSLKESTLSSSIQSKAPRGSQCQVPLPVWKFQLQSTLLFHQWRLPQSFLLIIQLLWRPAVIGSTSDAMWNWCSTATRQTAKAVEQHSWGQPPYSIQRSAENASKLRCRRLNLGREDWKNPSPDSFRCTSADKEWLARQHRQPPAQQHQRLRTVLQRYQRLRNQCQMQRLRQVPQLPQRGVLRRPILRQRPHQGSGQGLERVSTVHNKCLRNQCQHNYHQLLRHRAVRLFQKEVLRTQIWKRSKHTSNFSSLHWMRRWKRSPH